MIISNFRNFLEDESGAYTVWSLVWFSLYVAMGGLAVDMSDGYRAKMLLQSTADASALAAVISLPDVDDGRAQAVSLSKNNMFQNIHGTVLRNSEVVFGNWDFDGNFTTGGPTPNAAMVTTRRSRENRNMLQTNFLRIWGLAAWDVNTRAIAVRYIPDCTGVNGLVAGNKADITSNNNIDDLCIHGENMEPDPGHDYAVDLGNNNVFHEGAAVSMPDLDMLNGRPNVCTNNTGLCDPGTLREGNLIPSAANAGVMDAMTEAVIKIDEDTGLWVVGDNPPHYVGKDEDGVALTVDFIHDNLTKDYTGPFDIGHVYIYNNCQDNHLVQLNDGTTLDRVVIVADCKLKSNSGLVIEQSFLVSKSQGNGENPLSQHSVDFASNTTIGDSGFCAGTSDQVTILSYASMHIAAGPTVYGLRAIALGDFHLTAQGDVAGISVEAWNNITATAGGDFNYCGGSFDTDTLVYHHRLVR